MLQHQFLHFAEPAFMVSVNSLYFKESLVDVLWRILDKSSSWQINVSPPWFITGQMLHYLGAFYWTQQSSITFSWTSYILAIVFTFSFTCLFLHNAASMISPFISHNHMTLSMMAKWGLQPSGCWGCKIHRHLTKIFPSYYN